METFEDKAIRLAAKAEEQFIYKIYTYDAYGSILVKLLKNDRTFKTIKDVKDFLYSEKAGKSIQNTMKYKQLVICQKSDKWKIVEIIEPTI
jgi:hypothetical protein